MNFFFFKKSLIYFNMLGVRSLCWKDRIVYTLKKKRSYGFYNFMKFVETLCHRYGWTSRFLAEGLFSEFNLSRIGLRSVVMSRPQIIFWKSLNKLCKTKLYFVHSLFRDSQKFVWSRLVSADHSCSTYLCTKSTTL